jgi:hypothetical protein
MTDRRLSPTAANSRVKAAMRNRFKILRKDPRPVAQIKVDSQRVFAGRIVSLLEAAASDHPGEWSTSYAEWVVDNFADRYVELSRVAPIPEKAGAR